MPHPILPLRAPRSASSVSLASNQLCDLKHMIFSLGLSFPTCQESIIGASVEVLPIGLRIQALASIWPVLVTS